MGALYAFGPAFLTLTNPESIPIALVTVPFIWAFVTIFVTVWLLLRRSKLLSKGRRRLLLAGVTAALPVLVMVLRSIRQLTVGDVLLVIALLILVSFYVSKAEFIR